MKRRITIMIVFLLLGAIVNVAVAWSLATWMPQDTWGDEAVVDLPVKWPLYLQRLGWPAPDAATRRDVSAGVWVIEITGGDPEASWSPSGPGSEKTWVSLEIRQFGIPARALQWESHGVRAGSRGMQMVTAAHEAAGVRAGVDTSRSRGDGSIALRRLPLWPVLPGFIINTLVYAALLWLLFAAPFAARRMLRRRRGVCAKCAYPIGVSPVCTECGAAVREDQPRGD